MTTSVDFYLIKQNNESDRLYFACRLVEKIVSQGLSIYLQTDSQQIAQALDNLLWRFKSDSFLPHTLADNPDANTTNIVIGCDAQAFIKKDALLNLASEIPQFHSEFQRIVEIVLNEESSKQMSRAHWTAYKNLGYPLKKNEI